MQLFFKKERFPIFMSKYISSITLATGIITSVIGGKIIPLEDESINEIHKEINQQDISLQLAQQQARIAQELAIALRIEIAEEVEIEEFYDNSGDGNMGLKATSEDINLGISGSGRRITKRIYKFKGHNGEKVDVYQQKLSEILLPKVQSNID